MWCSPSCWPAPAEHLQKQFAATAAALEQRLAHGRQPDVRRDVDVVEADDRQLLRHSDAEDSAPPRARPAPACRRPRRSRSAARGAATGRSRSSAQRGGFACPHGRTRGAARSRRARAHARSRGCGRGWRRSGRIGRLVADEGDPPVAELDQVRRRQLAAVDVVETIDGNSGCGASTSTTGSRAECRRSTSSSGGIKETISSPSERSPRSKSWKRAPADPPTRCRTA